MCVRTVYEVATMSGDLSLGPLVPAPPPNISPSYQPCLVSVCPLTNLTNLGITPAKNNVFRTLSQDINFSVLLVVLLPC